MGGWGAGSFENEDAQKFLGSLQAQEPAELQRILARAADHEDYLNASDSSVTIAAAEVVATAKGNGPPAVPSEVAEWVSKIEGAPSAEMSELARRAVERVRTNSELKDLWLEAEGLNEWSAALRDLEGRLQG
jgi:multidrug efflux pump subunit AcrB